MVGGSGHVGAALSRWFSKKGDHVRILSRRDPSAAWDGRSLGPWSAWLDETDVLINLAGRSVDCRYHQENRRQIMDSRVFSTRILGQALAAAKRPPRVWLNASTATIYRHALGRPQDEATGELGGNEPGAPSAWNFSIDVAKSWEYELFAPSLPFTRRVALRSAMTMSPDAGSIFDVLRTLVRLGLGGTIASGRQYISWIHEFDFCRAVDFLIEREDLDGPVNLTSPFPLPNREFFRVLRQAAGQPIGLPATSWMIEIGAFFLRTESELVLKSRWVLPTRLLESGFHFDYPHWPQAAQELLFRKPASVPTDSFAPPSQP